MLCGRVWGSLGECEGVWRSVGECGGVRGNVSDCGEVWGSVVECGGVRGSAKECMENINTSLCFMRKWPFRTQHILQIACESKTGRQTWMDKYFQWGLLIDVFLAYLATGLFPFKTIFLIFVLLLCMRNYIGDS